MVHGFTRTAGILAATTLLVAGWSSALQTPASAIQPTPAAMPKVSIMVGGLNKQIYLTATLAKQLGLYEAEGVNVTLYDEPSGQSAEDAMLTGEVQFAFGSFD